MRLGNTVVADEINTHLTDAYQEVYLDGTVKDLRWTMCRIKPADLTYCKRERRSGGATPLLVRQRVFDALPKHAHVPLEC